MEPCKVCGGEARYILGNGDVVCREHLPELTAERATGCQVFCATRAYDREHLGERVTEWLRTSGVEVTDTFTAQSSDRSFHCISIVVFYRERS